MAQITQEQQLRREIEAARTDIERVRLDLGETLDQLSDGASPRSIVQRRKARYWAQGGVPSGGSAMVLSQQATANVVGGTHQLADQASSAVSSVADQARSAPEPIQHQTQGNPLAAGLLARRQASSLHVDPADRSRNAKRPERCRRSSSRSRSGPSKPVKTSRTRSTGLPPRASATSRSPPARRPSR